MRPPAEPRPLPGHPTLALRAACVRYLPGRLAQLGTIAAVAQLQFCTPSAVSQQLSALEREAGVPLTRRNGRGVELTAAGAELADRTGPVLDLLEQAAAALAASRTELSGELRIGAFPTAVRTLLPLALVALVAAHPGLELRVTELDPAQVPAALRARTLDLALVHEYDYVPAEPDGALATEPILDETVFLAAPGPAPPGRSVAEPVLASRDAPWIVASPGTLCHLMTVRWCEAAGFTPRIRHFADDFAAVPALVVAGQGVALVPELALADCPDVVTLTPLAARRRTLSACRAGAAAHPAVAAGAAAIREAAAAYPRSPRNW